MARANSRNTKPAGVHRVPSPVMATPLLHTLHTSPAVARRRSTATKTGDALLTSTYLLRWLPAARSSAVDEGRRPLPLLAGDGVASSKIYKDDGSQNIFPLLQTDEPGWHFDGRIFRRTCSERRSGEVLYKIEILGEDKAEDVNF